MSGISLFVVANMEQLQQSMLVTGIDTNNQELLVTEMEQQQQQSQLSSLVTPLTVLSPLTAVSSSVNSNMSLDETDTNNVSGIGVMNTGASSTQAVVGTGGGATSAAHAFSYDDLFPALPTNNAPPISNIVVPGCVRVTSTQMTQVNYNLDF